MKRFLFLHVLVFILTFILVACIRHKIESPTAFEIPVTNHDLSYIPYDSNIDDAEFTVCDSTHIISGRSKLGYTGGRSALREEILESFTNKPSYNHFTGFVVIRFVANCTGDYGRFRAQSLYLDFSPIDAPTGMLEQCVAVIQDLKDWNKSTSFPSETEYSKFINLKFNNGKIQHVLF